jgi:hypothetical protein
VVWACVGSVAAVLLVIGVLVMLDDGPPAEPEKKPSQGPAPVAPSSDRPASAPAAAAATPATPPAPPRVRPSDPFEAARFDAEAPGAGVAEKLRFADLAYERAEQLESDGRTTAVLGLRRDALAAYEEVVRIDKNHERARERLGYVKFDLAEAKRLSVIPSLPRPLKASLDEVIEQVEQMTAGKKADWPLWMSVQGGPYEDVAEDWRKARRRALELETLDKAKQSDDFYKRAANMAQAIEGDVGPPLRRRKVQGPTFDAFPNKPFVVLVQRDVDYDTQDVAERWTEILLQLRETFVARFRKLNLPPMDRPTPLLVLRYDTDYTKYLRRGDVRGGPATAISSQAHFEPFSKRLVTWKDPDRTDRNDGQTVSEDEVRTVLFHEGTHQLVDYYTRTRASNLNESLWFSEGIADYFGGHGRAWDDKAGKWRYEPGLINAERVSSVGDAKAGGFLFKLRDLLAYRRGDYERDKLVNPPKTLTAYAQGWALVYLLSNWNDQQYRDKFDEYVRREFNGESGVAPFEAVFGATAVDAIEKDLHAMIDVLSAALKEKRIVNGKLVK